MTRSEEEAARRGGAIKRQRAIEASTSSPRDAWDASSPAPPASKLARCVRHADPAGARRSASPSASHAGEAPHASTPSTATERRHGRARHARTNSEDSAAALSIGGRRPALALDVERADPHDAPRGASVRYHEGTRKPVDGWFQRCIGCGAWTGRSVTIAAFEVFRCAGCARKFRERARVLDAIDPSLDAAEAPRPDDRGNNRPQRLDETETADEERPRTPLKGPPGVPTGCLPPASSPPSSSSSSPPREAADSPRPPASPRLPSLPCASSPPKRRGRRTAPPRGEEVLAGIVEKLRDFLVVEAAASGAAASVRRVDEEANPTY